MTRKLKGAARIVGGVASLMGWTFVTFVLCVTFLILLSLAGRN